MSSAVKRWLWLCATFVALVGTLTVGWYTDTHAREVMLENWPVLLTIFSAYGAGLVGSGIVLLAQRQGKRKA